MLKKLIFLLCLASPLSAEIYELRTYTPHEGKMESLLARFQDHTLKIFENHGIKNIGYWLTDDKEPKLVYLIAHKDRETAKKSWAAFGKDPAWRAAYKASIKDGKLVQDIASQYLTPTDFSALK